MQRRIALRSGVSSLTFVLLAAHAVASPMYTVTHLGPLDFALDNNGRLYADPNYGVPVRYSDGFGPMADVARDIPKRGALIAANANGQVLSWMGSPQGYGGAVNTASGTTPLDTLGGANNYPKAINDSGQVVGHSDTTSGQQHAFVTDSGGPLTDLGTLPGGRFSSATAINNAGQIVGYADAGHATGTANEFDGGLIVLGAHAVRYDQGRVVDLGTLGGLSSMAVGINSAGTIAGTSQNAEGGARAFIYKNGTMTDLGTLGAAPHAADLELGLMSSAKAINNLGQVVGQSNYLAFVTDTKGQMIDLNTQIPSDLGFILHSAFAINDLGQILALGEAQGEAGWNTFLLTPTELGAPSYAVPEPTTLATYAIVLGGLALRRRMKCIV